MTERERLSRELAERVDGIWERSLLSGLPDPREEASSITYADFRETLDALHRSMPDPNPPPNIIFNANFDIWQRPEHGCFTVNVTAEHDAEDKPIGEDDPRHPFYI